MEDIREYNELVEKWNDRYGHVCKGMTVSKEDIENGLIDRVQTALLSNDFTERQKIKHTVTVIGDFSNISSRKGHKDGDLTRGEHAYMIVKSGKSVLNRY